MAIEIKIIISTPTKGGSVVELIAAGQPANEKEDEIGVLLMRFNAALIKSITGAKIIRDQNNMEGN